MDNMHKCLTDSWLACINGEEQSCDTLYKACDTVMKYVGKQKLTEDLYNRVWVECNGEVVNIYLASRIVREVDWLMETCCKEEY